MKKFNLEEYNKMCAELLGYVQASQYDEDLMFYEHKSGIMFGNHLHKLIEIKSMRFNSDWNWIMEVVESIENLFDGFVLFKIEDETCFVNYRASKDYNNFTTMATKKEAVVHAIWHFLNWYKENGGSK